jgi:phosphatidylserine/phosphatidylglycerophosphate/cardiolipin synthase-like enzyme
MNSEKAFDDLINEAKQTVWMAATFINNHDANLLLNALKRGAEVKVLATNQADLSILKKLVKEGAKVRVYANNLPYKLCIADGKVKALKENVLHEIDVAEAVKNYQKVLG